MKARIFVLLMFFCALAPARGDDLGPPIGTIAPDIGMPLNQYSKPQQLKELMGEKGLVLMFFRSADWCPYCQVQLMDVGQSLDQIQKRGYRVAAISYDRPGVTASFSARHAINITFLSDPHSVVIDGYHLRDSAYPPGSRAYGVPRPIVFILDRSATIKAKLYEDSYTTPPTAAAIIARIDTLSSGQ